MNLQLLLNEVERRSDVDSVLELVITKMLAAKTELSETLYEALKEYQEAVLRYTLLKLFIRKKERADSPFIVRTLDSYKGQLTTMWIAKLRLKSHLIRTILNEGHELKLVKETQQRAEGQRMLLATR